MLALFVVLEPNVDDLELGWIFESKFFYDTRLVVDDKRETVLFFFQNSKWITGFVTIQPHFVGIILASRLRIH
jgi:hypothetical protein